MLAYSSYAYAQYLGDTSSEAVKDQGMYQVGGGARRGARRGGGAVAVAVVVCDLATCPAQQAAACAW